MKRKTVNRNIPENRENANDRFRVKYKDKSTFELLEVNIKRLKTNESITVTFKSEDLPEKDSIYFSAYVNNKDELIIEWRGFEVKKNDTINDKNITYSKDMEESIEEKYSESFSPIVGDKPYVLILGTIPGNDSIRLKQYYANPRNLFWEIIHSLFNRHIANEYEKNTEFLKTKNIAIWDVCLKGKRESSLDSDISDEFPNDLQTFIHNYPSIKLIAFNGQKAEKLYNKYFKPFKDVEYFTLLSTSPANASYSYNEKFADWKRILDFINM